MGYYVDVFCTAKTVPPVRDLLRWLAHGGRAVALDTDANLDPDAADWRQLVLRYSDHDAPLCLDIERPPVGALLEAAREELREGGAGGECDTVQRVLRHLRATRFVVATELPWCGLEDEAGYAVLDTACRFFIRHCGGLMHQQGRGYYRGETRRFLLRTGGPDLKPIVVRAPRHLCWGIALAMETRASAPWHPHDDRWGR